MDTVMKQRADVFQPDKTYTAEEYLLIEDQSVEKHEFFNGEVIKMPGSNPAHNTIAANVIAELIIALRKKEKKYIVMTGDSKIYIPRFQQIVYPDAVVVCEKIELYPGSSTVITNPLLIVEVLSPSTEKYDRYEKFSQYKQIASFKEYLMVSQKLPYTLSSFQSKEKVWEDSEADGLDASIYLKSVDCTIALRNVYENVDFPT